MITKQPNPMRLTRERVSSYIAQCDYGESWYIHPVKIQWNPNRDEWQYQLANNPVRHSDLEDILGWCDPQALVEFYKQQVQNY